MKKPSLKALEFQRQSFQQFSTTYHDRLKPSLKAFNFQQWLKTIVEPLLESSLKDFF